MEKPKYLMVVERLAEDIHSGRLAPGTRIQAHRDLAVRFGVTISTVTRAVAEAQQRGLLIARPGSGTFVRAPEADGRSERSTGVVDLCRNGAPMPASIQNGITAAMRDIARDGRAAGLFSGDANTASCLSAAVSWLRLRGLEADARDILLSHGAQHGLSACLAALAPPGSLVLCEPWVYGGFRRLAASAGVRLVGVTQDEDGMRPDALDTALRGSGARLVLSSAAAQNPTTITMPLARRQAIVDVCRRHEVFLLEDDVFGHLSGDTLPPFAELAPERVLYVTGLSKSIAPGLRLGLLRPPRLLQPLVQEALGVQQWVPPTVMGEVFARMVAAGTAQAALEAHRGEMRLRLDVAAETLGPAAIGELKLPSYHLWLPVPPPWRMDDFVTCLEERSVRVLASNHFAVEDVPAASRIRICLGNHEPDALRPALAALAQVLQEPSRSSAVFV